MTSHFSNPHYKYLCRYLSPEDNPVRSPVSKHSHAQIMTHPKEINDKRHARPRPRQRANKSGVSNGNLSNGSAPNTKISSSNHVPIRNSKTTPSNKSSKNPPKTSQATETNVQGGTTKVPISTTKAPGGTPKSASKT